MPDHIVLITIGTLLLAGLAMDVLGERTRLPRVTLLVLLGIAAGPSGFDVLPTAFNGWYPIFAVIALVMVAFLLGGKLTRQVLAEDGTQILGVSLGAVIVTGALVGVGLWLIESIRCCAWFWPESRPPPHRRRPRMWSSAAGRRGPFSQMLLSIVAIDDAWGLIAFSLLLAWGQTFLGQDPSQALQAGLLEVGGAVLVGLAVGLPAAYLTGRLQPGEPSQVEALGVVFLCGGLALAFHASFLLAAMIAGLIVANFARHHTRAFHEIENVEWPFMVLFFVLAGASLDIAALPAIGSIGAAYMVLRIVGRIAGGWIGGAVTGLRADYRNWIGVALMPQAGVSLGMALIAATAFPDLRHEILVTAIGTTIIFELLGPLATQWALSRVDRTADRRPGEVEEMS